MSEPIFVKIINEIASALRFVLDEDIVRHIFGFIPVRRRLRVFGERTPSYRLRYRPNLTTREGNWGSLQ